MSAAAVIPAEPDPEGEAPAETAEETAAETTEAEQAAATEGEAAAAEGEQQPEAEKPAEIPEEVLKPAAEKYAAELVKRANTTMAAARRAEARTEAVKQENARLKETAAEQRGHLEYAAKFVERLRSGDPSCFAELGMTVRQYLDLAKDFREQKPETAETRLERLERERREEREAQAKAEQQRVVAEQQKLLRDHVASDKTRWHYLQTNRGHDELWDALREYAALHPNADIGQAEVDLVADAVEADLRQEFGAPPAAKPSAPRPGANNGASTASTVRNTKTLTSKGAAAAPGVSEFSLDPDERRAQVNARLRAEGLL